MRGLPFTLAHIQMIVARGAAPVDAVRWLAGNEAAVLPEIFARACAPAAMQAVDDGRCNAARFQDQPRHGGRKRAALSGRPVDRRDFLLVQCRIKRHSAYPSRAFNRAITAWMVSPSARAAKVSAMRCFNTGSASSATSSIDGA